jgi:hypothetical protein
MRCLSVRFVPVLYAPCSGVTETTAGPQRGRRAKERGNKKIQSRPSLTSQDNAEQAGADRLPFIRDKEVPASTLSPQQTFRFLLPMTGTSEHADFLVDATLVPKRKHSGLMAVAQ